MKNKILGIFVVMLLIAAAVLPVAGTINNKTVDLTPSLKTKSASTDIVWSDNFDSYTLGQYLEGTPDDGGWVAYWDNENYGAYVVNDQFLSSPHSVKIFWVADIVHNFSGIRSGSWTFISWVYVPANYTRGSYIFFLSYHKFNPRNYYAQLGITFDGNNGLVKDYKNNTKNLPLITDQWVEIRVEIDLEADWFECYYNDELLVADVWTDGWSYYGDPGFLNLGAVELCRGNSPIYYDDLSLEGEATGPVPNLNCEGSIILDKVKPGSTVKGNFTVENIGEPNSRLEWIVDEYPEWGSDWKFQPLSGNLTPEVDPITVEVSFKAPNNKSTGVIKVCAIGDPDDYDEIQARVSSRNKAITSPFQWFLQQHPNLFPILQRLLLQRLGLQ